MKPVCTAPEMRNIDRRAIEEIGIPGIVLMERAGVKTAEIAAGILREGNGEVTAIFCGTGNNGGDGMVIGRELVNRGFPVQMYLIGEPEKLKGDALRNYTIAQKCGIAFTTVSAEKELKKIKPEPGLVIDALLGTGSTGPVRGIIGKAVELMNRMICPIIAVDMPTGITADTGECHGVCVHADATVTMGLLKRGLCLHPGREAAGSVFVADIGFPPSVVAGEGIRVFQPEDRDILLLFPHREPVTNKTKVGKVLLLAGSRGLTGAATLASEGAMRAGAGLVILGIPESLNPVLETKLTETMTVPLPETDELSLSLGAMELIMERLSWATVVGMGPGLSRHPETLQLVRTLVGSIKVPMVLDADALFALSPYNKYFPKVKAPVVITPHEGEFARLMDRGIEDILVDRIGAAQEAAQVLGVTVLLKGAPTIVASPDGDAYINPTGNPGMASGGVGDVLTGIVAGFLGQGMGPRDAAVAAAYAHGRAGDIVLREKGILSLNAGDLPPALGKAILSLDPDLPEHS